MPRPTDRCRAAALAVLAGAAAGEAGAWPRGSMLTDESHPSAESNHEINPFVDRPIIRLATRRMIRSTGCWRFADCGGLFLNVTTRQGEATLAVGATCQGQWRHHWGVADARQTIIQWLDGAAAGGRGTLCIPLHPEVADIRITSTGGHCGEATLPDLAVASAPGGNVVLRMAIGASAVLSGCHARIGTAETGEVAYGGIALDFADGYGFGDAYAASYFYGVYDGFGAGAVGPLGATVYAISAHNTYHYRVDIQVRGRTDWRWTGQADNDR